MAFGWKSIPFMIHILMILIVIGVLIFGIGKATHAPNTDLATYIWFGLGILITWVLALRLIALKTQDNTHQSGWISAVSNLSLLLPTLSTLIPICVLIFIMVKIKPILESKVITLPKQYYTYNIVTFVLVVIQMSLLYKFYNTYINDLNSGSQTKKTVWIGIFTLISIITSATAIELYTIITSFITDG